MPIDRLMFVLVHSPLVGPATWSLVAEELRRRGADVLVPSLRSDPASPQPYWEQHVRAIAEELATAPSATPLILAGHSGAGVLLPLIRQAIRRPVAAYIFVDAGLPSHGRSRLDSFDDPDDVDAFRQSATGGFLPVWSNDDLREVIPDAAVREQFVAELVPLPLAVYEEALPVPDDWPDAPCGYLRFGTNPAYTAAADHAVQAGWPYAVLDGEHFHMLVKPAAVADALLELAVQSGVVAPLDRMS